MVAQQVEGRLGVVGDLELDVCLVEDHGHVVGDAIDEGADALRRQVGPGRVVGVADQHELSRGGDLGEDRVEVVDIAVAERDADLPRSGERREMRVHRERRPRVDELGPRLAERLGGGEQDLAGAVADRDPRGVGVVALGDPAPQQAGVLVGVAVGLGGGARHGLDDRRVRRPRGLVRGELDRVLRPERGLGVGGVHAGVVVRDARELVGEGDGHHSAAALLWRGRQRHCADCRSERSAWVSPR